MGWPLLILLALSGCSKPTPPPVSAAPGGATDVGTSRGFYLRAKMHAARGDTEGMRRDLNQMLRFAGGLGESWRAAGLLLLEAEMLEEAVTAFEKGAELGTPENRGLGLAQAQLGNHDLALELLGSGSPQRARSLLALGRVDEALDAAREMGGSASERAAVWLALEEWQLAHEAVIDGVHNSDAGVISVAVEASSQACRMGALSDALRQRAVGSWSGPWRRLAADVAVRVGDDAAAEAILGVSPALAVEAGNYWLQAGKPRRVLHVLDGVPGLAADGLRARSLAVLGEISAADEMFDRVPSERAAQLEMWLGAGRAAEVVAATEGLDDPDLLWLRAGALVALRRVDEAAEVARDSGADDADAALREARVWALAGNNRKALKVASDPLVRGRLLMAADPRAAALAFEEAGRPDDALRVRLRAGLKPAERWSELTAGCDQEAWFSLGSVSSNCEVVEAAYAATGAPSLREALCSP